MPDLKFVRRFDVWKFGSNECAVVLEHLAAHPALGDTDVMLSVDALEHHFRINNLLNFRNQATYCLRILACKWTENPARQAPGELKIDWVTGSIMFSASRVVSQQHINDLERILDTVPATNGKYLQDIAALATAFTTLRQQLEEHASETSLTRAEAQKALQQQRDLVAATTLTKHAEIFTDDAKHHRRVSRAWLVATLVSLAGVLWVAWGMWKTPAGDFPTVLGRLALLSVPVTALGASLRQYGAACHNRVLSTHRANALLSYDAFARVTQDNEARNAMLAHAIGLVFSVQDTGYSRVPGTTDSTSLFAELVKQIGSGKG